MIRCYGKVKTKNWCGQHVAYDLCHKKEYKEKEGD